MNLDFDPLLAEILAIWDGLKLALSRDYQKILVELDYAQAISAITSEDPQFSCADCWLEEIRDLSYKFISVPFLFCNRDCNGVGDRVAKVAR